MNREIPLSVPNLDIEIVENLRECIETGWVSTGGRFIAEFEEKVAAYAKVGNACGCQSGTAGLHTALRILGVGAGDEVIVPTLTFIGAVNPVRYLGAEPVFLDCDEYLCLDPAKLAHFCEEECRTERDVDGNPRLINNATGRIVRAVIPVHIFGNLCEMEQIMDIAAEHGLKILEDATEALGSFWQTGRYAGKHAGTVGDMGVFSFNANKIITTGGGGMIVARRDDDLERARYLTTTAKDDMLYFAHDEVGYNYRMLNIQAALGVSQISQIEEFIAVKKRNLALYEKLLADIPGTKMLPFRSDIRANNWFYSLYIEDDGHYGLYEDGRESFHRYKQDMAPEGHRRDFIMKALIDDKIMCRPVWKLVHTQKPYASCRAYGIERAYKYERHILNLPCSTNLIEGDASLVCERLAVHAEQWPVI
jgi:aminotransferase in exopolysaccharide biosynthesis